MTNVNKSVKCSQFRNDQRPGFTPKQRRSLTHRQNLHARRRAPHICMFTKGL